MYAHFQGKLRLERAGSQVLASAECLDRYSSIRAPGRSCDAITGKQAVTILLSGSHDLAVWILSTACLLEDTLFDITIK
jgi:hypothetical protein